MEEEEPDSPIHQHTRQSLIKQGKKLKPPMHWKKKPSHVYKDNATFGFSAYTPMIDYIDRRDYGSANEDPPKMPFMNERWMDKHKIFKTKANYSDNQVEKYLTRFKEHHNAFAVKNAARFLAYSTTKGKSFDEIKPIKFEKIPFDWSAYNLSKTKTLSDFYVKKVDKAMMDRIASKADDMATVGKLDSRMEDKLISRINDKADDYIKQNWGRLKIKCNESVVRNIQARQKTFKSARTKQTEEYKYSDAPDSEREEEMERRTLNQNWADKLHRMRQYHSGILPLSQEQVETLSKQPVHHILPIHVPETVENQSDYPNITVRERMKLKEDPEKDELKQKNKQMAIEIEQLNMRIQETEVRMKTEITRIKKKMQVQITELEMSLDVANKNNIELQKTIKKQSLQLTELAGQYDELQRQLQVTLDQLGVSQRRVQALQAELEEMRGNLEAAMRAKRQIEVQYEEATTRINELVTINVNLSSAKAKIESEFVALQNDYDELAKELKMADDRVQKSQAELKHTIDILHEEQERVVKIETIKKSLEIEVKNLTVRLEEVEANAIVGGKRVISKLEGRLRDLEIELDEEKRRHSESVKILRKKERMLKEVIMQTEEDQKNITLLTESVDKLTAKINIYKRQLQETEGMSSQNLTRVRRFQRELEAAEERAENAETNLSMIRAKHRSFVTSSQAPGVSVTYVSEEHHSRETM